MAFSGTMLAMTPAGDAYTFRQFQRMLGEAGFRDVTSNPLPPTFFTVVSGVK